MLVISFHNMLVISMTEKGWSGWDFGGGTMAKNVNFSIFLMPNLAFFLSRNFRHFYRHKNSFSKVQTAKITTFPECVGNARGCYGMFANV